MTTCGARLVAVSGLPSGSAAAHLRAAGGVGGSAASVLLAWSGLSSALAAVHLAADRASLPVVHALVAARSRHAEPVAVRAVAVPARPRLSSPVAVRRVSVPRRPRAWIKEPAP